MRQQSASIPDGSDMTDVPTSCVPETSRLAALLETGLLDTPPEASFDGITYLAKMLMGAPMSAISLVDQSRQWFKSRQGFDLTETPRSESFCTHAVTSEHPFVVLDAAKDPRFAEAPLVTGPPHIRFYLGIPLVTKSGAAIGALCIYDSAPRTVVDADQLNAMIILARLVADAIQLRQVANTDGLTHTLTNAAFRRAADVEVQRSRRYQRDLTCVILDVDHFKKVNDTYGHAVGDYVLRKVSESLKAQLRPFDIVGRLGGEEFGLVLPDTDIAGAIAVAERLRAAISAERLMVAGTVLNLSASFGVADCRAGTLEAGVALSLADTAMYASKKAGRNRVTCFDSGITTAA